MPSSGPDVDGAVAWVQQRLRTGLPDWLGYHDYEHTAGLVVPAAELLAADVGLSSLDRDLLRTAAWFHDIGFVVRYEANEPEAVAMAQEVLPGFGFAAEHVEAVTAAIWATRLPQAPTSRLAELLCDADLFVLGTDRFFERERLLRQELAHQGAPQSDEEWNVGQVAFVGAHRYITAAARARNDAHKAANLEVLRRRAEVDVT